MAIWKLEPINLNNRTWEASTYRGEVIVRADSETKAREIAYSAFVIATGKRRGEMISINPWKHPAEVSAVTIKDKKYEGNGKEEILGPPDALNYIDA